jgi:hypothetical protein
MMCIVKAEFMPRHFDYSHIARKTNQPRQNILRWLSLFNPAAA